jgi:LysM repeat protein
MMSKKNLLFSATLVVLIGIAVVLLFFEIPGIKANAAAVQVTNQLTSTLETQSPTGGASETSIATSFPQNTSTSMMGTQYVVKAGDTLSAIAAKFGITLQSLLAANPQISNMNRIMPGQVLTLPSSTGGVDLTTTPQAGGGGPTFTPGPTVSGAATPTVIPNAGSEISTTSVPTPSSGAGPTSIPNTGGGTFYTVKTGDSLGSIAARFNTTLKAVLNANPTITNQNTIVVGQVIFVPSSSGGTGIPSTGGGLTYTVQKGDTLSSIASKHQVSLSALLSANPQITNMNQIVAGQVIALPGSSSIPSTGGGTPTLTPTAMPTTSSTGRPTGSSTPTATPTTSSATSIPSTGGGSPTTAPTTSAGTSIPSTGGSASYTVKAGDTLFSIAQAHQTTVAALLSMNPQITNSSVITVGQKITLP